MPGKVISDHTVVLSKRRQVKNKRLGVAADPVEHYERVALRWSGLYDTRSYAVDLRP